MNIKNFFTKILKNIWIFLFIYFFITLKYPIFGIAAVFCMLAPVLTAFFYGRKWCGNFCPRGNFSDKILDKISLNNKYPKIIKTKWFKVLFFLILISLFVIQMLFAKNLDMIGLIFFRMVLMTTIITIILGIIYKPRAWCMFCPMGSLASVVAASSKFKNKIKHIKIEKINCVYCNFCEKVCSMEIQITKKDKIIIDDSNCIKCLKCVNVCKKNVLKYTDKYFKDKNFEVKQV